MSDVPVHSSHTRPPAPARGTRYTVVGASGFVGSRLCRRLVAAGGTVTALVRPTTDTGAINKIGVRTVQGDLVSGQGLDEAVRGAEVVIHLGGVTRALSHQEYWGCNAQGADRLARAAAAATSPPVFVLCSSLAAAGPSSRDRPRTERDHPAPVSWYGRSKLAGELAARAWAGPMPVTIVRPPVVYGPGDALLMPSVRPMVRTGLLLQAGFGARGFSLVHVDDVCSALLAAAQRGDRVHPDDPARGIYHLSDGATHSWGSFGRAVAQALGQRRVPRVVPVPVTVVKAASAAAQTLGRMRGAPPALTRDKARELACEWWTCSHDKARRDLALGPPIEVRQGLRYLSRQ
ncbi:NAD-dependent epimerase/dehydratase family protein [Streptomyces sp. NPDC091272]|uniref:NAD-dependent epimerase/dehydratase family protein n=1 Tax=Streptomyces sp. NPDC091272 TaxID=3365981 RepID=UPI0038294B92